MHFNPCLEHYIRKHCFWSGSSYKLCVAFIILPYHSIMTVSQWGNPYAILWIIRKCYILALANDKTQDFKTRALWKLPNVLGSAFQRNNKMLFIIILTTVPFTVQTESSFLWILLMSTNNTLAVFIIETLILNLSLTKMLEISRKQEITIIFSINLYNIVVFTFVYYNVSICFLLKCSTLITFI